MLPLRASLLAPHRRPTRLAAAVAALALAIVAPSPIGSGVALAAANPVARWTLDEGSGADVNDAIGSADGTLEGGGSWITSGAAVGSGALRFDGVNDRVVVPNTASLEPAQLSLSVWVRGDPEDPPAEGQVIVEKGDFACGGPSYGIRSMVDGVKFSVRTAHGQQIDASLIEDWNRVWIWDGDWHLISMHVKFLGNGVYLYASVDASPMANPINVFQSGPDLSSAIQFAGASSGGFAIGGPVNAACSTDYFNGDVDDVRLWGDPTIDPATLMTPIPTTITLDGPVEGHPWEAPLQYTGHVEPTPRWGHAILEIFWGGTWAMWEPPLAFDENGDVTFNALAPPNIGTYPVRIRYVPFANYVASSDGFDLDVTLWPSTTTLQVSPSPATAFGSTILTASVVSASNVASAGWPAGNVEFWDATPNPDVLLGTSPLIAETTFGHSRTILETTAFPAGARSLYAKYVGPDEYRAGSTSDTVALTVDKAETFVSLMPVGDPSLEANHSFQLLAAIGAWNDHYAEGATITFRRVGVSTPICTMNVLPLRDLICTIPPQPVGTWQYTATYSGNTNNLGSTSDALPLTIVADAVHATGVGLQYATFYPVKDDYQDKVAIKGTRNETIGVTIKIYKPSGTLLKTVTVPNGTGAYSYSWNGRKSDGSLLNEGSYKITQTLKDAAGTTKTWTFFVKLSHKRLVTITEKVTQKGSSLDAQGTLGTGSIGINTTAGYALLKSGSDGWAGAGWEFTLPSATVYKSIQFKVYAKKSLSVPATEIAMQNFTFCAYDPTADWSEGCFDRWRTIGNSSGALAWYSTGGSVTANRSGAKVRGLISDPFGPVYVYKARVVVTYGVLRY